MSRALPNVITLKPVQLCRAVWGLRDAQSGMTLISEDAALFAMDAPEWLPAGSCSEWSPPLPDPLYRFIDVKEVLR